MDKVELKTMAFMLEPFAQAMSNFEDYDWNYADENRGGEPENRA